MVDPFYGGAAHSSSYPPTLYEIRTHQSALAATNSNVKELCSSRMPWHPSKFNKPIIPNLGKQVKWKFPTQEPFHSRTMDVQSFEFDQTSHRLHSIIHKNVLGFPSLETFRVLEICFTPHRQPNQNPTRIGNLKMEHENGIEPSTSSMARTRSDQLSYSRKTGAPDGSRTHVISLEGWHSTVELQVHWNGCPRENRTPIFWFRVRHNNRYTIGQ